MNQFRYITLLATVLLMTACTSDGTLEDENAVDTRQPMVFGNSTETAASTVTRAVTYLENNFKVNTWKNFGNASQQVVMDGYEVDYNSTATPKWYYENVNSQILRYWDLSAFPYEFRAVTPYSNDATITQNGITLDATSSPFQSQTYINGTYSTAGEPFMVSHVKREKDGTDYKDTDIIRSKEINVDAKANATRGVHMPFHHLVSKVGFRIYINDPQPTSPNYTVTLKEITISVENTGNKFITASATYSATNTQGLIKGTFTNNTKQTGSYILLQHGEYTGLNLRLYHNYAGAYDLCPDFIMQIPQDNVKLRVQLKLETVNAENVHTSFDYNQLLSLEKKAEGDNFTWASDTKYIYYLHIPNVHGHEVELTTCQILPWDEVQTSDISIEL